MTFATDTHTQECDQKNAIDPVITHELTKPINQSLPLTDHSREVIAQMKEEAFNNLLAGKKVSPGILSQILSYSPAAKVVGQTAGWAVGQTFGASISNGVISWVCKSIFAAPIPKSQRWYEKMFDAGVSVGADAAEFGLKVSITPYVLPWITVFTTSMGGLSAVAVACIASKLYNSLSDKAVEPLTSMPPLEKLIQWDAEKAAFCDANGRPFTTEDLEDLFFIVRKIDLLEKIEQSDVDGVNALFNEQVKKIEDKANIKPKKLEKIKKVAGQVCGHAFRPKEIEKSIDFIIENAERYDSGLLCHKNQQLFKISKIFDHMKETLELPDVESTDKYEYDEHNSKLIVSGGNIHRRFYQITTESTAKAVEDLIGKSLADDCDQIDSEIEKMQNVNEDVLEYVDRKILAVQASYDTFYEKIGQSNKGAEIQPKVVQLINDYQAKLTKFRANLQDRLLISM